jgi:hypothetical protein
MHAKYRLKRNFLAEPETNLSSHSALNVAFSPRERERTADTTGDDLPVWSITTCRSD